MDFVMWRKLFAQPTILLVVAVTAIQSSAQNTVFFYLVPGMKAFVDATPTTVSALLAAFGIAGVVGNAFVGQLADRHGAATLVLWAMLAMLAGHLLWPWSAGSLPVLALSIVVWGLGCFATNSAQQARLAGLSPAHAPVSLALNTSAVYLGHAVGAAAGGALLVGVLGPSAFAGLTVLSVPLFLLAIGLSIYAARRCRTIRNP